MKQSLKDDPAKVVYLMLNVEFPFIGVKVTKQRLAFCCRDGRLARPQGREGTG